MLFPKKDVAHLYEVSMQQSKTKKKSTQKYFSILEDQIFTSIHHNSCQMSKGELERMGGISVLAWLWVGVPHVTDGATTIDLALTTPETTAEAGT